MNIQQLHAFYSGKRVFLTGHTGFKGAWMTLALHQLGAKVIGYSLPPKTEQDLFVSANIESLCEHHEADIREQDTVRQHIEAAQPDIIFHLAAQPIVLESYEDPIYTYATNVMGTAHVLDALRHLKKPCVAVMITTDKVYENKEHIYPYREIDRLGGFDPYSNSKACAELVIQSMRDSFFHPDKHHEHRKGIASARSGNIIGGGDWTAFRIIPDLARAFKSNEPLTVRNPQSVRPWQHVLDPIFGYLLLGMKLHSAPICYSTAYNFGPLPQDELTVQQLVEKAIEIWGSGSYDFPQEKQQQHEAKLLKLDISKAITELKWKPLLDSAAAIEMTLDWYKNAPEDARDFTLQQLKSYMAKL